MESGAETKAQAFSLCTVKEVKWRLPTNRTLETTSLSVKERVERKSDSLQRARMRRAGSLRPCCSWGYSEFGAHGLNSCCLPGPPQKQTASSEVHFQGYFSAPTTCALNEVLAAFPLCCFWGFFHSLW